jgi:tRNA A37 N6-isopentenylltransferase MiaA
MNREKLYERIDARVDHMMQAGLVEEVSRLRAQGLTAQDVSMQGIGYRQILKALDGEYPMEEAVRLGIEDHIERRSRFDRAADVQSLKFYEDLGVLGACHML